MALIQKFDDDPFWYQNALIYELHVKTFFDSDDDGTGEFQGLTKKLDYLASLGVTAIWLLPFYPSPLKDDGYDIADYLDIHPQYGQLHDFRRFLYEAHRRGLRVITELVINHTSDQHPWFQKARHSKPGSIWRDYYVWSDTPEKYKDARIIFKDFEPSNWTWDPIAKSYYWHRFYAHQPDLNFENPRVQKEIFRVLDFWLEMGVDGMRLDAVPYLFEEEGTNCANLPKTHAFLKKLRAYVDSKYKNRMLLAEANQWPEEAVQYLGSGDECHMAFHFPIMPRLFMGIQMEDRFPILSILEQTPDIPKNCQWAMFLRNHDELTLEMVTDEERDYMWRTFAEDTQAKINFGIRRRLAPLLGNNRRKIELMNILLFSLPGTPVIYYGDEIGMGDNYYLGDRNGVRTPMQWSPDRNAGFSRANSQKLLLPLIIDPEYHYEAVNVESQDRNLSSLLWWMKRVIAMRKRCVAFGRGTLKMVRSNNHRILSFMREYEDEKILVVANLSRFAQMVELDLSEYAGYLPEEIFSHNKFSLVRESPYVITLGPHGHFWLQLKKEDTSSTPMMDEKIPELGRLDGNWKVIFDAPNLPKMEKDILPKFIKEKRWFGAKTRTIRKISIFEKISFVKDPQHLSSVLTLLQVQFSSGQPELYLMPLAFAFKEELKVTDDKLQKDILCAFILNGKEAFIYDGVHDPVFCAQMLKLIVEGRKIKTRMGELKFYSGSKMKKLIKKTELPLASRVLQVEQSNTSVLYQDRLFLKIFRHCEEGQNPDVEVIKYLTEKTKFDHIPVFAGAIEYMRKGKEPIAIGSLASFIPDATDAWSFSQDALGGFYDNCLSRKHELEEVLVLLDQLNPQISSSTLPLIQEMIGAFYIEMISLLAKRTAQMHMALSTNTADLAFSPEPFTSLYQRSLYQSVRNQVRKGFLLLTDSIKNLPVGVHEEAQELLSFEKNILENLEKIFSRKINALKTRIHGDFHLGQVLFTGQDFVMIDFEGEPARSLSERRLKHSPLRDIAGMLRSFHYAAYNALKTKMSILPEQTASLEPWADLWYQYMSGVYLRTYRMELMGKSEVIPQKEEDFQILLDAFLIEKAVYEISYELNHRPDWVSIPIKGLKRIITRA